MRKFILLFVLFVTISPIAMAQSDSLHTSDSDGVFYPKSMIKWHSLFLFNRFPTPYFSYEFNVKKKLNLSLGVGYVLGLDQNDNTQNEFQNPSGIKSGLELRRYLSTERVNTFFISVGLDYFYVKYDRSRTFGFECNGRNDCAFFQFDRYSVLRQDRRVTSRVGIITELGDSFYLEMALGFGINSRKFRTEDRISGFDIQFGDTELREDGTQFLFLPSIAFNLAYKLK